VLLEKNKAGTANITQLFKVGREKLAKHLWKPDAEMRAKKTGSIAPGQVKFSDV
jgi:hypothetical protein